MVQSIFYGVPNLVCICIDRVLDGDAAGRLYHYYQAAPIPFHGLSDMMLTMDQFYDDLRYPQAEMENRRFGGTVKSEGGRRMKKVQSAVEMTEHKGDLATFVVHVQYRQNATWQGKVVWTDTKQESHFRSALELVKLMDNAMTSAAAKEVKKANG